MIYRPQQYDPFDPKRNDQVGIILAGLILSLTNERFASPHAEESARKQMSSLPWHDSESFIDSAIAYARKVAEDALTEKVTV